MAKKPAHKKASKKAADKKSAAKKAVKKPPVKKAVKKAPVKKAVKKSVAKKPPVKKAPVKEPAKKAAKKAPIRKPPAKKPVKKAPVKKPVIEKPAAALAAPPEDAKPVPMPPARVRLRPKAVPQAEMVFRAGQYVVYPAHGVGEVTEIAMHTIAGIKEKLLVVFFAQERMRLSVPFARAGAAGMRPLAPPAKIAEALNVLRGRAKIRRTMWSRRAQEYEDKINSGDLLALAEVVRDLYRAPFQQEQSYSERQLFEVARERMAREVAAVERASHEDAAAKIENVLLQAAEIQQRKMIARMEAEEEEARLNNPRNNPPESETDEQSPEKEGKEGEEGEGEEGGQEN